ncbi:hypothetical protein KTO58_06815 [Chitinophaga pendula]|uniref:hypothetical protein n=1 Tax=Chitinophaga TaxID=79328 RepID=UPI000BAF1604|nr:MULTISPECIES: hypothetical protein [Chitinophaga]ASZ13483.1 hypothetical protein CK934_22240 [Chitinophaga sp. MD30]UCJ08890.1 hypothetical protein KTO58_06815 [Chitinophaga pendula]
MKISLEHLSADKVEEIRKIVGTLITCDSPEKIILMDSKVAVLWKGSSVISNTSSLPDYAILVVTGRTNEEYEDEYDLVRRINDRCKFDTPVTIFAHSIDFVNERIREQHPLFSAIKREGILLYDAGTIQLARLSDPSASARQELSRKTRSTYTYWISTAQNALKGVDLFLNQKDYSLATFLLRESAERAYIAAILLFIGIIPRNYNLEKLRKISEKFSPELAAVFVYKSWEDRYAYCSLYLRSDLSFHRSIYSNLSEEELLILLDKVKQLISISERLCTAKLAELDTF